MRIVGYTEPLSVAPGDRIRAMVSTDVSSFQGSLERLAGAGGPASMPSAIDGTYPGRAQALHAGSYVVVGHAPALEPGLGFTLEAWVWPTAPGVRRQAVCGSYDGWCGYALGLDETGA
ncbi:MAG TPA: hypothetical protein VGI55_01315, partial [Solirubrobacteraceae bacterium]